MKYAGKTSVVQNFFLPGIYYSLEGAQWLSGRVLDSSLTGVTALWSLSKTHLFLLSTGSTQEDRPYITERLLMGRKE